MARKLLIRLQLIWLTAVLSACASVSENLVHSPKVNLSKVQVVGVSFRRQTFLLSFDVANPNPFPLPVSKINYGIKLDGQRFASGETVCDFTVPADGETSFAISVDLNLLQTAPQLLSIVRDGTRREIAYQLDGRLGVGIPMTPTLKYRNSGKIQFDSDAL